MPLRLCSSSSRRFQRWRRRQETPVKARRWSQARKPFRRSQRRVIAGFMIQTGGHDTALAYRAPPRQVVNESRNGLSNRRWSVAMARHADPDSAGSQFYINMSDNRHLDATADAPGYTVFGQLVAGFDVADGSNSPTPAPATAWPTCPSPTWSCSAPAACSSGSRGLAARACARTRSASRGPCGRSRPRRSRRVRRNGPGPPGLRRSPGQPGSSPCPADD